MATLNATFKFEISGMVFFKHAQHDAGHYPTPFTVTELVASMCPGGVQKSYRLEGRENLVPEVALTSESPSYTPTSQAAIDDRIDCDEARRRAEEEYSDKRWEQREAARKDAAKAEEE